MLMVKYRKKKKKKNLGKGNHQENQYRKSSRCKIRARKNGTSPPPLKDKCCIEKVSEHRPVSGYKTK